MEFCRKRGILVQARGSAANSAVCYSLGITAVDPVGMELLFERFFSEVRGEWPNIDLDLPSETDRERAIQYVYERYGELGADICANVITYSADRRLARWARHLASMRKGRPASPNWSVLEVEGTDTMKHHFRNAGCDLTTPVSRNILSCRYGFSICPGTSASTQAA